MKSKLGLLFGLIILLIIVPKQTICREPNSIKFEVKKNYKINNFSQDTTLVFEAHIGKYPKYYGLKNALDSIENTINKLLQGDVPYKVFSSINNIPQETYSIKNQIFTYKIKLKKCEEQKRYWKFAIAGVFYLADTLITSYNDLEPNGGEVTWLLIDKSKNWDSTGVTRLGIGKISREDVNKYIIERNKHIDLINTSDNVVSSQHTAFSAGHLFFTCSSLFGIISNKSLVGFKVVDLKLPNIKYEYSLVYQDQSIGSIYSKNQKTSAQSNISKNPSSNNSINNQTTFLFNYNCYNCFGQKLFKKESSIECSNCNYWTRTQKEYNVCTKCRNTRRIVTKSWSETCKVCNGRGSININLSAKFEQLLKNVFHQSTNFFDSKGTYLLPNDKVYFTKAIDSKKILLECYDESDNCDIILNDDGTLLIKFNNSYYSNEIFKGSWTIDQNNKFIMKALVKNRNGQPKVAMLSNLSCQEIGNLGAGFIHTFDPN